MSRQAVRVTVVLGVAIAALLAGCSRERIDWKSAESADTLEGYNHFLELHPDSELATQARTRMVQLTEEKDWSRAVATDNADAYKAFLAQHSSGKYAEEARIRVESFALNGTASPPAPSADTGASPSTGGAAAGGALRSGASASGTSTSGAAASGATDSSVAETGRSASAAPASHSASAAKTVSAQISAAPPPKPTAAATTAHANPATPVRTASATPAGTVAHAGNSSSGSANHSTAAGSADTVSYGIQLGAFSSQAAALAEWKRLQTSFDPQLHGLFAHAVPLDGASGKLFRLQSPVGDEARARGICAALAQKSQPCVVVLPKPR